MKDSIQFKSSLILSIHLEIGPIKGVHIWGLVCVSNAPGLTWKQPSALNYSVQNVVVFLILNYGKCQRNKMSTQYYGKIMLTANEYSEK